LEPNSGENLVTATTGTQLDERLKRTEWILMTWVSSNVISNAVELDGARPTSTEDLNMVELIDVICNREGVH
jgi:hypothetical protein